MLSDAFQFFFFIPDKDEGKSQREAERPLYLPPFFVPKELKNKMRVPADRPTKDG